MKNRCMPFEYVAMGNILRDLRPLFREFHIGITFSTWLTSWKT